MKLPNEKHISFYEHQIKAAEDIWKEYATTPMKFLIQERRLFVARIWGKNEKQGFIVLRCKEGEVPRMKQPYFLGIVGIDAPDNPHDWNFSYEIFRSSPKPRYYSGIFCEIYTINYWKTENGWSYILVSGFDLDLLSKIEDKYLSKNIHPQVIIAETDPPVDYLIKLKEFVSKYPGDNILGIDIDVEESNWNPLNLDNKYNIIEEILQILEKQHTTLIQGPPGTGKSYLAAEICQHFLDKNKSVCVTALTNKALIEIADKDGLIVALNQGRVFKTNLSNDELKKISSLKASETFSPKNGELLLTTYYKLAQKQAEILTGSKRFDLMIIEEASQAFLATLAMFSNISKKVLIIGDHKQLLPIVYKKEEIKQIHPHIEGVVNGMETFAYNNNSLSYRLTKTRRLTSDGAALTGIYYKNSLKSISDLEGKIDFSTKYKKLFHENGGATIVRLPSAKIGFTETDLLEKIAVLAKDLLENNIKYEVALLTPYKKTESDFYKEYNKQKVDFERITISTVHKIQGLTCDLTILYLPLTFPSFDLDDNLFNVSTSRAKSGTLIITYEHIRFISLTSQETRNFILKCTDVTEIYKKYFLENKS